MRWLRFEHTIEEPYGIAVPPGVRQAEAIGFVAEDTQRENGRGLLRGNLESLAPSQT